MQVSNVQDHCTHAVIGGKETIEFGISSSAEFFNILSSTLYSNQILAVVREVLCNAWDAHIAAGKADTPVEVEMSDSLFRVRDFGTGIPHESIGPIYGTYGNSTKANDGKQTGGFGLGCKAPFAYVDHFEVTSTNAGIRTIYTMSKSSAQAMGKPGITPITSFPSQDSGLQVSIQIKHTDFSKFVSYLRLLAYYGDIKVSLNGEVLKTIGMTDDFAIIPYTSVPSSEVQFQPLQVRYGNVVYPIPTNSNWKYEYSFITDFLSDLRGVHKHLILQAPPHSIAVTPSRESLSLQDHTINTIKKLLEAFVHRVRTEVIGARLTQAEKFIEECVSNKAIHLVLASGENIPVFNQDALPKEMRSMQDCLKVYVAAKYPYEAKFIKEESALRAIKLADAGLIDKGLGYSYAKEIIKPKLGNLKEQTSMFRWTMDRVFVPLFTSLDADPSKELSKNDLYVVDTWALGINSSRTPVTKAKDFWKGQSRFTRSFLRKVVVISASAGKSVCQRIARCPELNGESAISHVLMYYTPKKASIAPAIALFKRKGYEVLDFTQRHSWDLPVPERQSKPTKKAQEGWPVLSCIADGNYGVSLSRAYTPSYKGSWPTISEPEFFFPITESQSIYGLGQVGSRVVVDLFGKMGCVAKYQYELTPLLKKNVPELKDWLLEKVIHEMKANAEIKEFFGNSMEKLIAAIPEKAKKLFNAIRRSPSLCAELSIAHEITGDAAKYLKLWQAMLDSGEFRNNQTLLDFKAEYDSTPLSKPYMDFLEKMKQVDARFIDTSAIFWALQGGPTDQKEAREFIFNLLNP